MKLLVLTREWCEKVFARRVVNVQVKEVQCDEIQSFFGKKQKRVRDDDDPNLGDQYVFFAN